MVVAFLIRACLPIRPVINFTLMVALLVVTSDFEFGDLVRQNLERAGHFSVLVTGEKNTAIEFVEDTQCSLALLDTCMTDKKVLEIGSSLRQANPGMRFIVISEAGWHSTLEELSPENYLEKPLHLPDLMKMMDNLFGKKNPDTSSMPDQPEENLPWLSDVTRAAQHLTRLTLETSAQAALITSEDKLWAYAGQLPQSAARELAETVTRYWDRKKKNDLVRFVRLATTEAEHMLYATRLDGEMVLALIFDAETPFSTIRTQASSLVRSLSASPAERQLGEYGEDEAPMAAISDILSDIPSPNPDGNEVEEEAKPWKLVGPAVPQAFGKSLRFSRETSPAVPVNRLPLPEASEATIEDLEKTIESAAIDRKKNGKNGLFEAENADTRPAREMARKIVLEPISPSVYNLDYSCLLIPRLPQHHLTGDLSDSVSDWVPQICVAFGWRLEYISVRPEYLLWIANVTPATSPGYLMRILRQHSSQRIFEEFPRFKKENPSGDFWAAGYLIMGGSQPPPGQLIKDFISQTRQRQGFSH
jgi:REP element-mobilizing transposase RayT/DNA-binding response OmpR family regulator